MQLNDGDGSLTCDKYNRNEVKLQETRLKFKRLEVIL